MPDYREMYFKMFRASQQAINLLIATQQECEELSLSGGGPKLEIVPEKTEETP